MSASEADIERHNRRELWRDVERRLTVAVEEIELAQSALADLDEEPFARDLQAHTDALGRFRDEAKAAGAALA